MTIEGPGGQYWATPGMRLPLSEAQREALRAIHERVKHRVKPKVLKLVTKPKQLPAVVVPSVIDIDAYSGVRRFQRRAR